MSLKVMKKRKAERRKAQRMRLPLSVKYKVSSRRPDWQDIECKDISGIGLGLYLSKSFRANEKVHVAFSCDRDDKPIKTVCRVVWCKKVKSGLFRCGVEIIKATDPMALIDFVCTRIMDTIDT